MYLDTWKLVVSLQIIDYCADTFAKKETKMTGNDFFLKYYFFIIDFVDENHIFQLRAIRVSVEVLQKSECSHMFP